MLNRKTFINRHIHILSYSEAITVKLLSLDKMAELPHRPIGPSFVFILTIGPIEIKAIDLSCALVLAICITMLLIFF